MVRIYLKDKDKHFDIEYSSILKLYFLGWLGWMVILVLVILILSFLASVF